MAETPEELQRRLDAKAELDRQQIARHACPVCGVPVIESRVGKLSDAEGGLDSYICERESGGCGTWLVRDAAGEPWRPDPTLNQAGA